MSTIIGKLRNPWLIGFCVLALAAPVAVQAFVPGQISYQGKLTDGTGAPVADDTYPMVFTLYDASSVPLWSETQANVLVVNGIFNVMLPVDPGTYPFPAGLFDQELFLGVQVGTDAEMTPRQPLTATPFAFKAADADTLEGRIADEFADASHDHDFADLTGLVNDAQVPDTITIEHAAEADYAFNADLLDGQDSIAFAPAIHEHTFAQIAGQASDAQVPNDVTIEFAANAGNADTVDGLHSGAFMAAGTDNWVDTTGDTMNGRLEVSQIITGTFWGEAIKGILYTESTGAGVYGLSGGPNAYGVAGGATGANGAGVYGEATGTSASGLKGYATGTNGIGVYGEGPAWAGYFDGGLYASGNVGIGTVNPTESKVHVVGDLKVAGDDGWNSNGDEAVIGLGNVLGHFFVKAVYGDGLKLGAYATTDAFVLKQFSGNVGIGTASPTSKLDVNGTTTTKVLAITGGADIAEPFDIKANEAIKPGMVLTIDAENQGKLKISEKAYDRCVAGIISAAGGIQPGMIMSQTGTLAEGEYPIALTGRVYCWADADNDPIQPGDLLTTSDTPGHAMKAMDFSRSQGAVIGKAMTSLDDGKGLVLVLVSLQ
jgi:hypothetical protein